MKPHWIIIISALYMQTSSGVQWSKIHCLMDTEEKIPEGLLPKDQIGRFSWLGVIQYDFYKIIHSIGSIGRAGVDFVQRVLISVPAFIATYSFIAEKLRHAITGAVLIHPAYALAPAEDMARVDRKTISNTTRFIAWYSDTIKYSMRVEDYILHHEFELEKTLATIALVEVIPDGATTYGHPAPILSICLPFRGIGTFENLYVVKMTDVTGELMKEVIKVDYVDKEDCDGFYEKAELDYKLMIPTDSICVTAQADQPACVWDGGSVLVSRQADSWTLLGFGTHGPGCGAPARFIDVNSHMEWIDIQITAIPAERAGDDTGYILRALSPVEIIMYKPGEHAKTAEGQCRTSKSTGVIYRDSSEVLITNNYGRGYFFLALSEQADFSCLIVNLHCNMRSNAALWVEHHCYKDMTAMHRGQDRRRLQCYKYFKSTAYIEFRFTFSYLAKIEVKVYGSRAPEPALDPWAGAETTLTWWPTDGERHGMRWGLFVPVDAWWNWL